MQRRGRDSRAVPIEPNMAKHGSIGGGRGLFGKLARSMPHIAPVRLRICRRIFASAELRSSWPCVASEYEQAMIRSSTSDTDHAQQADA